MTSLDSMNLFHTNYLWKDLKLLCVQYVNGGGAKSAHNLPINPELTLQSWATLHCLIFSAQHCFLISKAKERRLGNSEKFLALTPKQQRYMTVVVKP